MPKGDHVLLDQENGHPSNILSVATLFHDKDRYGHARTNRGFLGKEALFGGVFNPYVHDFARTQVLSIVV